MPLPDYTIDPSLCTCCAGCASVCPVMAIVVHDDRSEISARCTACGTCERFCPVAAIHKTAEAAS